jgi:hypothetical protein
MDTREAGRRAAQRWTGLLSAAGIALTGIVGFGTYHLIEANKAASTTGATGAAASGSGSGPTVTNGGGGSAGLTPSSGDDGGEASDDGAGASNLAPQSGPGTNASQGGLSQGSGPSMTGSSGS